MPRLSPTLLFITATTMAATVASLVTALIFQPGANAANAETELTCQCECGETLANAVDTPTLVPTIPDSTPTSPDSTPTTAPVPRVEAAKATIKGKLGKDIVRRIVRAHINEVRACYNTGLVRDPELEGRVAIQFTIAPDGHVPIALVAKSTLRDRSVDTCISGAVKGWKFPKRESGHVVVTYPFVLSAS